MDTSETYIKMCKKAEEIQSLFLEKNKSGWIRSSLVGLLINAIDKNGEVFTAYGKDLIWLPRQDQLQEMMQPNDMSARTLLSQFALWSEQQKHDIPNAFASMEQLWLAFVMKKKYNKVWNGEDWVKA